MVIPDPAQVTGRLSNVIFITLITCQHVNMSILALTEDFYVISTGIFAVCVRHFVPGGTFRRALVLTKKTCVVTVSGPVDRGKKNSYYQVIRVTIRLLRGVDACISHLSPLQHIPSLYSPSDSMPRAVRHRHEGGCAPRPRAARMDLRAFDLHSLDRERFRALACGMAYTFV